ncbi:bifunctional SulP family inorganic anion transporter/carbonic anhydrase [Thiolapillus sp.]|uniref:bifunctional SulP family inorganic anion transporter/carbonic anhydrase n=1 Tax=Thiolapillus sp. TaxID=2017437 RepID=UPI003AF6E0C2
MLTDRLLNKCAWQFDAESLRHDVPAGIAVFLIALPLCLGIAIASGAPLFSGLIAGIIGGIVVASLSGSALGVSGPAAGLVMIVFNAIEHLGFEAFLLAVVLAGIIQLLMGRIGAGIIGYYFPSAVIAGMLSGIGIILFLKKIPHALGYDRDYVGDIAFFQRDDYTTLTELQHMLNFISPGAVVISVVCLGILLLWETNWFKRFWFSQWLHGALVAVLAGVALNRAFIALYPQWALSGNHLVQLPVPAQFTDLLDYLTFPDFTQIDNPQIYGIALTIAIIASLETLLSVEATDKLDPYKRVTPNNRELKAQGIGNILSGLLGGLPVTQVVVRSSANIQYGGRSKLAAIEHGLLLLLAVLLMPEQLNKIPLASLAAILLVVGYKLAQPSAFRERYRVGMYHFIPFFATIIGLIFTDMLTGIGIGMGFAFFFILMENLKLGFYLHEQRKLNKTFITLSENVTFLNKANLLQLLDNLPNNSDVVIDATIAKYIDYDVYEIIENFKIEAKHKNINLIIENLRGYGVLPPVRPALPVSRESQQALSPRDVLAILKSGNERFVNNLKSHRNLLEQVNETMQGQFPIAIILSCIDSRTSAELIFDQGLGDIFSVRVAGNVINEDILGCMEFACKLAGSKLIVVLGHSHCGAIKGACQGVRLDHLSVLLDKIQPAVESVKQGQLARISPLDSPLPEKVAARNVEIMVEQVRKKSPLLDDMANSGGIGIVGAMYDIETGEVTFHDDLQETGKK